MRRYHPDINPSAAAAAQVRAITAAYAVLGAPDRRAMYDLERARMMAAQYPAFAGEMPERRQTPLAAVSFGVALILLLLLPVVVPSRLIPPQPWEEALAVKDFNAAAPQERTESAARSELARFCSSEAASGLIKQELFRRAAQLRGSNGAAFFRVAAHSVVRFESPVLTGEDKESGTISCKASVAVDLPPGVVVPGTRRTLVADIGYSLRAAHGVADMVSLSNAGPIVTPLAGVAQTQRRATDQLDAPAAPNRIARNERARVVEQMSSAAQPREAAVARTQASQSQPKPKPERPQPRPAALARPAEPVDGAGQTPAWQQPLKPAWQRPLQPAND